ncbi:MAG: hypothetical protein ACFFDJ_06320 [Candidatus Odinarchaeota archaeon]
MARKDLVKQTLLSLLQEAEPAVADDALFLGKMKIHCTESGYANIQLSRPLDIEYVKQFFQGMDVYTEANQASVIVKKNANVFLYAEPNNTQRIAFGPVMDIELLVLVFKYIRTTMTRNA